MGDDDISTTTLHLANQSPARKNRSHSPGLFTGKIANDDNRISKMSSEGNRPASKLPNLLPKATMFSSSSDSMQLKRYRSTLSKDFLNSSTTKFERQGTNINSQTRLPTLYSLTSDSDQRRLSETRRRQIYALNHLMRELEQEQFREFCKLNNIGFSNQEVTININENINKD